MVYFTKLCREHCGLAQGLGKFTALLLRSSHFPYTALDVQSMKKHSAPIPLLLFRSVLLHVRS